MVKCSCCQKEIETIYSYTLLVSGRVETFLASFCGHCWQSLVPVQTTRRLRSFENRIMGSMPERKLTLAAHLPG